MYLIMNWSMLIIYLYYCNFNNPFVSDFLQHLHIPPRLQPLHHILSIKNHLRIFLHKLIINLGMSCRDNNQVRPLNQLRSQGLLPFLGISFMLILRNIWIIIHNLGTHLLKLLNHSNSGTLTIVIYVLFVSNAQHKNLCTIKRLLKSVKNSTGTLNAILWHPVIYHHRRLNHRGMETILARLPAQIIRVQRNAVAAKTRARIKRCKAKWLSLSRFYNFPKVNIHLVPKYCHLINQPNVNIPVSVLQNLIHLSHSRTTYAINLSLQNCLIHSGYHLLRILP